MNGYNPFLEDSGGDDDRNNLENALLDVDDLRLTEPLVFDPPVPIKQEPETQTKNKKTKKNAEPPVVITSLQQREALDFPSENDASNAAPSSRYAPKMVKPDPSLFTKEVLLPGERKDDEMAFIHFEEKDYSNIVAPDQKLQQEMNSKKIQAREAEKIVKPTTTVYSSSSHYNPVYGNPFRYPFIKKIFYAQPLEQLGVNQIPHTDFNRQKIETIPRSYDVDFLREPFMDKERPCVNGNACVARTLKVKGKSITLREYYIPSQYEKCKIDRMWPDDPQECLLCMLKYINKMYFNAKADQMGIESDCNIAPFCHKVGVEGEYRLEDCICSTDKRFMGLWGPVLLFKEFVYEYKEFEMFDSTGTKHTLRGFHLNLEYPTPDNSSFFRKGSLALEILEESVRSQKKMENVSGTIH